MEGPNKVNCPECGTELRAEQPPFPPQVQNGQLFSTVAIMNGHAECPNCRARFITQIAGVQLKIGFVKLQEESKIVVPNVVPPNLKLA